MLPRPRWPRFLRLPRLVRHPCPENYLIAFDQINYIQFNLYSFYHAHTTDSPTIFFFSYAFKYVLLAGYRNLSPWWCSHPLIERVFVPYFSFQPIEILGAIQDWFINIFRFSQLKFCKFDIPHFFSSITYCWIVSILLLIGFIQLDFSHSFLLFWYMLLAFVH